MWAFFCNVSLTSLLCSESRVTDMVRETMGSSGCRLSMISHVLDALPNYNETVQVLQLTARILKHTPRTSATQRAKPRPKSSSLAKVSSLFSTR